ncbi:MAG: T9SS type A sorting domain-containing protein [Saprospiraceae bacterium]|nr:T9SS type A sorting domain-containing protein [Saprospiraceae bacterium]
MVNHLPNENGIASTTGKLSQLIIFGLKGSDKISGFQAVHPVTQGLTGPSTQQSPYILPDAPGVQFTSILSAGETINGYTLCGIPDGMGAYDNGNGNFTILLNHEVGAGGGAIRAHGSTGAFVSKWTVRKSDLKVLHGEDLIKSVNLWNGTAYVKGTTAFSRLCSGDLAPYTAFYHKSGFKRLGTMTRLFLNGEEIGAEGRAFAHIVTGSNAGVSYELPYLGRASWENVLAHPESGEKTIVALLDDSNEGQVYFYYGTKGTAGNEIDKAGLSKGKLYGLKIEGYKTELDSTIPSDLMQFSLADLGTVQKMSGAELNTLSNNLSVTSFKRPEDGTWISGKPNEFYFVTTNAFNAPSRMWKLTFNDLKNPAAGGTISVVLNGTEGHKMMDNICADNAGHLLIQEDVGNNARLGKIWQYNTSTDLLKSVGEHDPTRFLNGGYNYLTQDEESSGIVDIKNILGQGMFLLNDQAHYTIGGEVIEGGQILVMFNPDTYNERPTVMLEAEMSDDKSHEEESVESKIASNIYQMISNQNSDTNLLKIYPNPISTGQYLTLELNLSKEQMVFVSLYNISGQQIWNEQLLVPGKRIRYTHPFAENLNRGIYLLSCRLLDKTINQKIIIK